MSIDELCALPVESLAAKDCLLFLWATFPMLPEALRLIKAWGFSFKTVAFVWLKQNRKAPHGFMGWDAGREETRKFACWQSAAIRNVILPPSISLLSVPLNSTVKSRT